MIQTPITTKSDVGHYKQLIWTLLELLKLIFYRAPLLKWMGTDGSVIIVLTYTGGPDPDPEVSDYL